MVVPVLLILAGQGLAASQGSCKVGQSLAASEGSCKSTGGSSLLQTSTERAPSSNIQTEGSEKHGMGDESVDDEETSTKVDAKGPQGTASDSDTKFVVILSRHGQKVTAFHPLDTYLSIENKQKLAGGDKKENPVLTTNKDGQNAGWKAMYHGVNPGKLPPTAETAEKNIGKAFRLHYGPELEFEGYADIDDRDLQSCNSFQEGFAAPAKFWPTWKGYCNADEDKFLAEGARLEGPCTQGYKHLDDYRGPGSNEWVDKFNKDFNDNLGDILDEILMKMDPELKALKKWQETNSGYPFRYKNHKSDGTPLDETIQERTGYYQHLSSDSPAMAAIKFTEMLTNEYYASMDKSPTGYVSALDKLGVDAETLQRWFKVAYWEWAFYKSPWNLQRVMPEFMVKLHRTLSRTKDTGGSAPTPQLQFNMAHDVNVHLLALALEAGPWPDADTGMPQLVKNAAPYHLRVMLELTNKNKVRFKVFCPAWEQARAGFLSGGAPAPLEEGVNVQSLTFRCGSSKAKECPLDAFLQGLVDIYKSWKGNATEPGLCITADSDAYMNAMIAAP